METINPNTASLNEVLAHLGYTVRKVPKKFATAGFVNAITTPDGRDLGCMKAETAWWYLCLNHPELWGPKLLKNQDEREYTREDGTVLYVRKDEDWDASEDGPKECSSYFARDGHTGEERKLYPDDIQRIRLAEAEEELKRNGRA